MASLLEELCNPDDSHMASFEGMGLGDRMFGYLAGRIYSDYLGIQAGTIPLLLSKTDENPGLAHTIILANTDVPRQGVSLYTHVYQGFFHDAIAVFETRFGKLPASLQGTALREHLLSSGFNRAGSPCFEELLGLAMRRDLSVVIDRDDRIAAAGYKVNGEADAIESMKRRGLRPQDGSGPILLGNPFSDGENCIDILSPADLNAFFLGPLGGGNARTSAALTAALNSTRGYVFCARASPFFGAGYDDSNPYYTCPGTGSFIELAAGMGITDLERPEGALYTPVHIDMDVPVIRSFHLEYDFSRLKAVPRCDWGGASSWVLGIRDSIPLKGVVTEYRWHTRCPGGSPTDINNYELVPTKHDVRHQPLCQLAAESTFSGYTPSGR